MLKNDEYTADRHCPVFGRTIDCDLCYESVMALSRAVRVESVPELDEVKDIESARILCDKCKFSNLE